MLILGGFFFLNTYLDHPEKIGYLIIDKYEKKERNDSNSSNPYFINLYLVGIDEKTERKCRFSTNRGDFYQTRYNEINPEQDKYWIHAEEGPGFFKLRWCKKVIGIFDYPVNTSSNKEAPGM